MKTIQVAVGVIKHPEQGYLISKRHGDQHLAGLWEFPGGKIEPGESKVAGLARELQEELGITVESARELTEIRHSYPEKSVCLCVYLVDAFSGDATGKEGQEIRWVTPDALADYAFPAANKDILDALHELEPAY